MLFRSANLQRYDGVRYGLRATLSPNEGLEALYAHSRGAGFGAEVKRRILLGTFALSAGFHDAYYLQAARVRRLLADDGVAGGGGLSLTMRTP